MKPYQRLGGQKSGCMSYKQCFCLHTSGLSG